MTSQKMQMMGVSKEQPARLSIKINRKAPPPLLLPFTDYFKGFEKVDSVRRVFGKKTEAVLGRLKVSFIGNRRMYMGIRDADGNISIGTYHLRHSDLRTLYLDVVHELFHVGQFMKNREYFRKEHEKFMQDRTLYYASPIEVPAYKHTVDEAKRLGMSYEKIVDYLKMGPAPQKAFEKFLQAMELGKGRSTSKPGKLPPVKINRKPKIRLFPFRDYFEGFEKAESVGAVLGEKTEEVFDKLKIEFVSFPFRSIFPSEEDGHLLVSRDYFMKGSAKSLYLDVFLCLNLLKGFTKERNSAVQSADDGGPVIGPAFLESYGQMVREARRIGIPGKEIMEHLQLARFLMPPAEYGKFLGKLGLAQER